MTAKRFTTKNIICSDYCMWDNNDKPYGNNEVVKLLNELHEENQSLKFQLDKCRNDKLFSRRQLEKENEQLKHELKTIKNILFDLKEIESYWDSSILQNVIDNIAETVGVDLDD